MKMLAGSPAPPPKMPDPVRIPNATDPDIVAAAKAKTQLDFQKRKGRSSTNLSGESAAPYSRTTLG